MAEEDWQNGGFGLYIHWPFCQAKCPYCDFNSHVSASVDQEVWKTAFLSEIRRYGRELPQRTLNTVFFGGGTPSLMEPDLVHAILEEIRLTWPRSNSFEVSLEANPTSVEAGRFAGYRQAGVNRISMGIQALNDEDLRRLGRLHSAKEAMQAFDIARKEFERVSFDLIYARQDQSLENWRSELSSALDMAVDHLSLYQLTIEGGTAFGDRYARGGLKGLPNDDLSADMYLETQDICEKHGMPAYETSNHARDGAESRHNLIYWRYGDYVGIGPGAHGRITLNGNRFATETPRMPQGWLDAVTNIGSGENSRERLAQKDQAVEYLMMSLRLAEGTSLTRFANLNGAPLDTNRIQLLVENGFLNVTTDRIKTTREGRPLLNAILRELLT